MAVAVVCVANCGTALSMPLPANEKGFHSEIDAARLGWWMPARLRPVHRKTAPNRAVSARLLKNWFGLVVYSF
jgi:hypothetical protein